MPRRSSSTTTTKGPRPYRGPGAAPTPFAAAYNRRNGIEPAPTTAADADAQLSQGLGALTLDVPVASPPRKLRPFRPQPFRFFDLPYELRLEVYRYYFVNSGDVLDLDPDNHKRIHKKLGILRTCRRVYTEASYLFYSTHPVRIFPTHPGRFFKTKKPLLSRMKTGQRSSLTSLQLRLGPGWSKPPRGWVVNQELGLAECVNVRKVQVYLECDPGNEVFRGFRQEDGWYEGFSRSLLESVLDQMPWVERIEFDAWPSVRKTGALMRGLLELVDSRSLERTWGPDRGWTDAEEEEPARFGSKMLNMDLDASLMAVMAGTHGEGHMPISNASIQAPA